MSGSKNLGKQALALSENTKHSNLRAFLSKCFQKSLLSSRNAFNISMSGGRKIHLCYCLLGLWLLTSVWVSWGRGKIDYFSFTCSLSLIEVPNSLPWGV